LETQSAAEPLTHDRLAVVAGATGYLGGHVVRALHARGFRVRVLARDVARLASTPSSLDPPSGRSIARRTSTCWQRRVGRIA
jgi:uncharacterized protein YbjT (DUF2867 family)